ncbi:ubiquitin carboxyl-terminal hydrolase 26 [Carica papaya]|uniref:ubiquitin carboxyl-terminal hydrolase 26 n=1 Tax=Carica papaya TaxID=3649 RepID=UPI000B8CFC66|nr:ubiquitin carboxyl-terminal hydrolase 26 [Carica papaya]
MSRPTTRNKNKRHRQADNGDTTLEILRKIHATGDITDHDINQLYMIWKPICQGCRVNTKDNPNCFCGLVPPPNGSRKTGLWQKMSDIVQALGPDLSKDLRPSASSPAGLTNLGATCYANSILQCLYMNKLFREGVFSVEPDVLKQQPVLDQLARLFAQLHASKMAFIDSAPFITTLELDNGVQQDSHEFLTLLLSLLEHCLSHSRVSGARTIVQDLFRGSVSHVTTCSKCGKDSEASSKMEDFYELELNVKGLKSLDESLDDYLNLEELNGDNQYFCESCNMRVDATRSIKLRTLPSVLNFQLKRCVFLPKTTMKKKITTAFSFPGELDMQRRLSEPTEMELIYDLSAVLIHKGTAVNSGHYVAHIKDENTGQWWEFDDEHVSKLGDHPFGEGSSSSNTKAVQSDPVVQSTCSEGNDSAANQNHRDVVELQSSESIRVGKSEIFSSSDAYMLMYNLRRHKKDDEKANVACLANGMDVGGDRILLDGGIYLPPHLYEVINNMNMTYLDVCEQFKVRKEKELNLISERRQEVRSVLSEAPVQSIEEPFYWISTDWLRQWADNIMPPVLDNKPIQCLHKKVPVSMVGSMKRLSSEAWTKLISKVFTWPKILAKGPASPCPPILANSDLLRLQQWVKRRNLDAPIEADAEPTSAIRCPHGELFPEQAAGAKRLLVPENLWLFLYEDAITVKSDDPLGCSTFPSDSRECAQCSDELSEVACIEDSLRAVKLKQRQNHEKLAAGKSIPLSPNCKYYLVPSQWLAKWRSYISASGKNASSVVKPETLDGIIGSLKCEKHLRLLERPPDLVHKRGSIYQKGLTTDRLTIVTGNDWKCFCEEWDGCEENGVSAIIELSNVAENSLVGSCQDTPMSVEHLAAPDEINNDADSKRLVVRLIRRYARIA